jgi:broad specificity phosphatase PhoE
MTTRLVTARQAAESCPAVVRQAAEQDRLVLLSSDFRRAAETARVFADAVGAKRPVKIHTGGWCGNAAGANFRCDCAEGLRERWFGALDRQPNTRYEDVWVRDKDDADHTEFGAERYALCTPLAFQRARAQCERRASKGMGRCGGERSKAPRTRANLQA